MSPPSVCHLWAGGIFYRPHLLAFFDFFISFFTIAIACALCAMKKKTREPRDPRRPWGYPLRYLCLVVGYGERSLLHSCYRPSTPGHRFRMCGMTSQVPYDNRVFQLQHTAIIHRTGRLCKQSTISQLLFNILQFWIIRGILDIQTIM